MNYLKSFKSFKVNEELDLKKVKNFFTRKKSIFNMTADELYQKGHTVTGNNKFFDIIKELDNRGYSFIDDSYSGDSFNVSGVFFKLDKLDNNPPIFRDLLSGDLYLSFLNEKVIRVYISNYNPGYSNDDLYRDFGNKTFDLNKDIYDIVDEIVNFIDTLDTILVSS